jgi:hypothetical protein
LAEFFDPRSDPARGPREPARTTTELADLVELHQLCQEGRLYEAEQWVRQGRPLQIAAGVELGRRRFVCALDIVIEAGNHSLALLLLSNGLDPNLSPDSPLDIALRSRRWDLVDLLLEWGADPERVDLEELFGTYRSELFQRFWDLGVDLTERHELAEFLIDHQGAKPLFGFAKRHREDPRIQQELNVALAYHAAAGNDKGTSLCLWAGGDPHVSACDLRHGRRCTHRLPNDQRDDDDEPFWSAIDHACRAGHVAILERLKPDPVLDDFDELYGWARDRYVVEYLMGIAPPKDENSVLQHHLWRIGWFENDWRAMDTLRSLFEAGLRWTSRSKEAAAGLRHILLKLREETFIEVVALLAASNHCAPEILREIGRTPAMKKRFMSLGYFGIDDEPSRSRGYRYRARPTHVRRVIGQFGLEPPKPKKRQAQRPAAPAVARIGRRRRDGEDLQLDRAALFEKVWSTPVATLAAEWGLSGPGLKKACHRLAVPVPPRGYWARVRAGQRPRRPRLPAAPPGTPSTLVVSVLSANRQNEREQSSAAE